MKHAALPSDTLMLLRSEIARRAIYLLYIAKEFSRRTMEALTLLVVAYAKAESMHENPAAQYTDLRTYWGQFLDSLLGKVKNVL